METTERDSKVKQIGTAVFGQSWMTQTARYISKISHIQVTRSNIQKWHNSDRIPPWAHKFLRTMAEERLKEMQTLYKNIDSCLG